MVGDRPIPPADTSGIRVLREDDLPAIARLARECGATMFSDAAFAMGSFRGVFDGGRLVSMAGTRGSTPSTCEISAVATVPEHRGRGLSARVVTATRIAIEASGRTAFLHVTLANTTAIRLYDRLGFSGRSRTVIVDELRARRDAPTADAEEARA